MKQTRGWHKILRGWYRYDNAAGKTLAVVERIGSVWIVKVLPLADEARRVTLSAEPATLKEAKRLAEGAYKSLSRGYVQRDPMSVPTRVTAAPVL